MTITDFFSNTAALKVFIKGIDISTDISGFAPMYRHAAKKFVKLVGSGTYDLLKGHITTPPDPAVAILDQAVEYARGTMANLLALAWFAFNAGDRNKNDNLYRYQENEVKEKYLENAWAEFDELINLMESDIATAAADESETPYVSPFTAFAASDLFKERENLYITSAGEFDKIYGIDNSSYFYFNAIFIQQEVEKETIYARVKEKPVILVEDTDDEKAHKTEMLYLIRKAIAFETVARACQRFDYTELPKNLRNDSGKEIGASVNRNEMGSIKDILYSRLHAKALEYLSSIDLKTKLAASETTPDFPDEVNSEDNKFYLSV
jgi:hypothetical protein